MALIRVRTYLFDFGKLSLHTLDGDEIVGFDGLRLQYFREGAFALLRYESISYMAGNECQILLFME